MAKDWKTKYEFWYRDKVYTLRELSEETGINYTTLYYRVKAGLHPMEKRKHGTTYKITDYGRECTKCKQFKSWDCFYNNKRGIKGKAYICVSCS